MAEPSYLAKLKEKQENQRQLVDAIDDLQKEKYRIQIVRLKYLFALGVLLFSIFMFFDSIAPIARSLVAEVVDGVKKVVGSEELEFQARSLAAKVSGGEAPTRPVPAPPVVPPIPKREPNLKTFNPADARQSSSAAEAMVMLKPMPAPEASKNRENFREVANPRIPSVKDSTPVPSPTSYKSLTQIPPELKELENAPKQ